MINSSKTLELDQREVAQCAALGPRGKKQTRALIFPGGGLRLRVESFHPGWPENQGWVTNLQPEKIEATEGDFVRGNDTGRLVRQTKTS